MTKRRVRGKGKPAQGTNPLFRAETAGSVLVLLAIFTLLSLLSPTRGNVTGALIQGLRVVFGAGVWLMPVLFAVFGVWLLQRKSTPQPALPGMRILGVIVLFLIFEALAHILIEEPDTWALAADGRGGGVVGWLVSQTLLTALGESATVAVLVLATLGAIMALTGLTLAELRAAAAAAWRWLRGAPTAPQGLSINPTLPLGHEEPAWKRWWRRFLTQRLLPTLKRAWASLQPPASPQPPPSEPGRQSPQATPRPDPSLGSTGTTTITGASPPAAQAPRNRGAGGQSWRLPVVGDVLEDSTELDIQGDDLRQRAQIIEKTLDGFGLPVQVVEANQGPAVTQFGLRPGVIVRRSRKGEEKRTKVRVSQIQALSNDLALALSASPIRIEAPVPGRDVVGVEVPNVQISLVSLRGVMESEEFRTTNGDLKYGLGRDVSGQAAVADLVRMPHLLIAGATGSGKSVCVNAIITALLLTHTPDTLRFLMVDPKRVELTVYNGIPHLLTPVVVDVERAVPVLQWATKEMDRRYKLFAKLSARNIDAYNEKLIARGEQVLPYVVILIDELADLMLSAPEEVERYICRIAQMARATGIHLVIATQRPSVDVVTGLIKANFPARIAFAVTSQVDSRVILDTPGAEQLLGRGDMLFMAPDASKLHRLQGCYVSDRETQRLVRYWRGLRSQDADTQPEMLEAGQEDEAVDNDGEQASDGVPEVQRLPGQEALQQPLWSEVSDIEQAAGEQDDLYRQAVAEVRKSGRASVSLLQRRLRIGYSRAARLIDEMETNGVIGPDLGGSRGREVLPESGDGEAS